MDIFMEVSMQKKNRTQGHPKSSFKTDNHQDDYGDHGYLTHYLGNDDYHEGNKEPNESNEIDDYDGYEAAGNDLDETDNDKEDQRILDDKLSLRTD